MNLVTTVNRLDSIPPTYVVNVYRIEPREGGMRPKQLGNFLTPKEEHMQELAEFLDSCALLPDTPDDPLTYLRRQLRCGRITIDPL